MDKQKLEKNIYAIVDVAAFPYAKSGEVESATKHIMKLIEPVMSENERLMKEVELHSKNDDRAVDEGIVGTHYYPGCASSVDFYTSDCKHGCGCWMGGTRSGAPDGVDPFGECPNNKAPEKP